MRWQSQPSSAKKNHATHSSTVCFLFREMPSRTWRTIEIQLFSWAVATHNNKCVSDATNVGGCAHAYTTALGPWNSTIILLSWNCCFFWILSCARIERRHLFVLELLHCSHTYDGAVSTDCSRCLKLHAHVLSARRRLRAGAERVVKPTHYTSNLRTWIVRVASQIIHREQLVENLFFLLPPEDLEFGVF